MALCSPDFLAFLAVTLVIYYAAPRKLQPKILPVASLCFYTLAGAEHLPFILFAALVSFFCGRALGQGNSNVQNETGVGESKRRGKYATKIEKRSDDSAKIAEVYCREKSRRVLILGLFLLFLPLVSLKIISAVSFGENASVLGAMRGGVFMPLGLSFYTLQCAGYLIDVSRGKCAAERSFLKFCGFVFFFPQLFLGPISRYSELSPQIVSPHSLKWENAVGGVERIAWGFFKKLVIAERVLVAVRSLIEAKTLGTVGVLLLSAAYSVMIYADFTGGVDIALGAARLFGITLCENFREPFSSTSAREFWNRWHITLGAWFTDYIFYPLSISRPMQKLARWAKARFGREAGRKLPVYLATLITWMLTGLWHGLSANFLFWGLANAAVILLSQELEPIYRKRRAKKTRLSQSLAWRYLCRARTFFIIGMIRLFDVFGSVPATFLAWGGLFLPHRALNFASLGITLQDLAVIIAGICLVGVKNRSERGAASRTDISNSPRVPKPSAVVPSAASTFVQALKPAALIFLTLVYGKYGIGFDSSSFIYSQF